MSCFKIRKPFGRKNKNNPTLGEVLENIKMTDAELDEWERKAKETVKKQYPAFRVVESGEVVLSLISALREAREILEEINHHAGNHQDDSISSEWLVQITAKALDTDQKEKE